MFYFQPDKLRLNNKTKVKIPTTNIIFNGKIWATFPYDQEEKAFKSYQHNSILY